jgi:hypothetical protein
MIFGKTHEQRLEEYHEDCKQRIFGQRCFAFFPTELYSGQYVWLQYYYEYENGLQGIHNKLYRLEDYCNEKRRYLERSNEYIKVWKCNNS